jgi:hypothetical protein
MWPYVFRFISKKIVTLETKRREEPYGEGREAIKVSGLSDMSGASNRSIGGSTVHPMGMGKSTGEASQKVHVAR